MFLLKFKIQAHVELRRTEFSRPTEAVATLYLYTVYV